MSTTLKNNALDLKPLYTKAQLDEMKAFKEAWMKQMYELDMMNAKIRAQTFSQRHNISTEPVVKEKDICQIIEEEDGN